VLLPRLVKRFVLVSVLAFLVSVMLNTTVRLPLWFYVLVLPTAAILTFVYWRTFSRTETCPTCKGTGEIEVRRGREFEMDVCYSCDGEGRVPRVK
jgi:membrane protein implicated in regulation of membrane protease activity